MNIIFLDIDGVLNNHRFASLMNQLYGGNGYGGGFRTNNPKYKDVKWDFYNVGNLKTLMHKTHARIVISSSWRRFHTQDHFKAMFQLYGLPPARIIGNTILQTLPGWIRGDAINKYISDYNITNYVILDDAADFYPGQILVRTDPEYGLTDDNMLTAVSKLNIGVRNLM